MSAQPPSRLHRVLGVRAATVVGLSAMLGTGIFAVWTPALDLAGSVVLVSLLIAAVVAALNAVSTARLARVHPESGGAYAYGRLRLNRFAGVTAGVAFLIGKSASASAAALTIGVYLWPGAERWVALAAIAGALLVDLRGIVRSTRVSALLIVALIVIVVSTLGWGAASLPDMPTANLPADSPVAVVAAAAIIFVAFAGYARITVLGEEVKDPARTIPLAMICSFGVVLALYVAAGWVTMSAAERGVILGPAPIESIAELTGSSVLRGAVVAGAVLGAGAVLINLISGMGRTLFAMASAGDAPRALGGLSRQRVPHRAAITVAVAAGVMVIPGRLSWALALSGASILVYYSVAHVASFTLPGPWVLRRLVPIVGLALAWVVIAALLLTLLTSVSPA